MAAVAITCAVTGWGDTVHRSNLVPVAPRAIADDCVEAARAGAAIVCVHVRDTTTGGPSRDVRLYREVVERVRASDVDVILNLATGVGATVALGSNDQPLPPDANGTDMAGVEERLEHIAELRPEIASVDCATMNGASPHTLIVNTTATVQSMARHITALGVRPELQVYDSGHLRTVRQLVDDGIVVGPPLVQLRMGTPYGASSDLNTLMAIINNLDDSWTFAVSATGGMQLPYVALAAIAGGHVRVGLADNLYLDHGMLATNAQLVERAVRILESLNYEIKRPAEVRTDLSLTRHA